MATAPLRSAFAETSSSRRVPGSPPSFRVGPWPAILGWMSILYSPTKSGRSSAAASAAFDAIWNIKPRLFGLGGVASLAGRTEPEARPFARHEQPAGAVRVRAQPRDSYGYRCGLRLAQAKNPSVLFVPSSVNHCTSAWVHCCAAPTWQRGCRPERRSQRTAQAPTWTTWVPALGR